MAQLVLSEESEDFLTFLYAHLTLTTVVVVLTCNFDIIL